MYISEYFPPNWEYKIFLFLELNFKILPRLTSAKKLYQWKLDGPDFTVYSLFWLKCVSGGAESLRKKWGHSAASGDFLLHVPTDMLCHYPAK